MDRPICAQCGSVSVQYQKPGHFAIELLLWCCFLAPGIIYTIWRYTAQRLVCDSCGSQSIISAASPRGRELMAQYHS